jgi:hypothetical protein
MAKVAPGIPGATFAIYGAGSVPENMRSLPPSLSTQ